MQLLLVGHSCGIITPFHKVCSAVTHCVCHATAQPVQSDLELLSAASPTMMALRSPGSTLGCQPTWYTLAAGLGSLGLPHL